MQKIVLVTGASRGIGATIAQGLAADGCQVAFGARRPADLADCPGLPVQLDVTDQASVDAAVATVQAELGPIDVLVNNAGIAGSAPLGKLTDDLWNNILDVNLTGSFRVTRAVLPGMVERKRGRVVFIASNAGLTGYAYTSAYCASKHGVVGFARALAAEVARSGVTVNCVCPGFVRTDMTDEAVSRIQAKTGRDADAARGALERLNPQNRVVETEEILHLVRALIDDGARGVNGQAIALDGGQVMK